MSVNDAVSRKIEQWRAKLVDLTKRNHLLYFRRTRASTLQIAEPGLAEVFDQLVVGGDSWQFYDPRESDEDRVDDDLQVMLEEGAEPREDRPQRARRPDELRTPGDDFAGMQRALRNLYRRARTERSERGVRVLYLIAGMLEWKERAQDEPIRSPLILVPVDLIRPTARDPFSVSASDDDLVLNPALEVRLKQDGITLPAPPDEWDHGSIGAFLDSVRERVQGFGWTVIDECWIAALSFFKLAMYADLGRNKRVISCHLGVGGLAGARPYYDGPPPEIPNRRELDALVAPKASHLILDADSSQLAAIEAAKRGVSFVLHGPPGTGKTQTIANLIAEFLAAQKKVLFVSEKLAALEQVQKRLKAHGLADYCLELHALKSNKRDVIQEIDRCSRHRPQPRGGLSDEELARLERRRSELNRYVDALHVVRMPISMSAYGVLGNLANLDDVPYVPAQLPDPLNLDVSLLGRAHDLALALARHWSIVVEGPQFPWTGCAVASYSLDLRSRLAELLADAARNVAAIDENARGLARALGQGEPVDLAEAEWIGRLVDILSQNDQAVRSWFSDDVDLDALALEISATEGAVTQLQKSRAALEARYAHAFFELPQDFSPSLETAVQDVSRLFGAGDGWIDSLIAAADDVAGWLVDLRARCEDWRRDESELSSFLGLPPAQTVEEIEERLELFAIQRSGSPPLSSWLSLGILSRVKSAVDAFEKARFRRDELRVAVLSTHRDSILALDLEGAVEALSTRYASWWGRLRPAYRRLRRAVLAVRIKESREEVDLATLLPQALELKKLEEAMRESAGEYQELFGAYFRGWETDPAALREALTQAQRVIDLLGSPVPAGPASVMGPDRALPASIRITVERLAGSVRSWRPEAGLGRVPLPPDRLPTTRLPIRESKIPALEAWSLDAESALARLARRMKEIVGLALNCQPGVRAVLGDLRALGESRERQSEIEKDLSHRAELIGEHYAGLSTDWTGVRERVRWVHGLREHLGARPPTNEILRHATRSGACELDAGDLLHSCAALRSEISSLRLLLHEPPGGAVEARRLSDLLLWLEHRRGRLDDLEGWIAFRRLAPEFSSCGLGPLYSAVTARGELDPQQLPRVVKRTLLQSWYDSVRSRDPDLARFRREDHEAVIDEFRRLDHQLAETGHHRVIRAGEHGRDARIASAPPKETAVLRKEANKKRMHLPLRRFFAEIPVLLGELKPCLLMSPLAVSHFLDSDQIRFDLVIFDEASQVCAEDAIAAVYRGHQLIVCGDNRQLPPTSFFEGSVSSEFDDSEEGDDDNDIFESILDASLAADLRSIRLKWHYRSRHEGLIAFSNRMYYSDDPLVTFPSARDGDPRYGVEFIHVPDGVYDRGGRRDNRIEAERVVDILISHLERTPERSIGIVTFNLAQRDAVEDLLERIRRDRPEIERFFSDEHPDAVFVKNLESVQGDERDVIIFSVGYGRDAAGNLSMNFGPLNRKGGERRLNVAITRAREKVMVVSSVRASDLDLQSLRAAGALGLHKYLDYAERGLEVLETRQGIDGEAESPLETSVASALRQMGFDIIHQVGCSGYRIDLGVVDPARPGEYLLGVECDGAMYHSGETARDRDRLRQNQLERLGWRIVRVWGPDWVSRRDTEVSRLRAHIEAARSTYSPTPPAPEPPRIPDPPREAGAERPVEPSLKARDALYRVAVIRTNPLAGVDITDGLAREVLISMLQEVVDAEAPVHLDIASRRIAKRWGLQRVGERIETAIVNAARAGSRGGRFRLERRFLYSNEDRPPCVRRPDPDEPGSRRSVDEIAPEEGEAAILTILESSGPMDESRLVQGIARSFGFDRTGHVVQRGIARFIDRALASGAVVRRGTRIMVRHRSVPPASPAAPSSDSRSRLRIAGLPFASASEVPSETWDALYWWAQRSGRFSTQQLGVLVLLGNGDAEDGEIREGWTILQEAWAEGFRPELRS